MENTLFFHGKTTNGRRFTVAGKFIKKGVIVKNNFLALGISVCSRNDAFIKKVGRSKAEGRILTKGTKGHLLVPIKVSNGGEIKAFIDYATTLNQTDSRELQQYFSL